MAEPPDASDFVVSSTTEPMEESEDITTVAMAESGEAASIKGGICALSTLVNTVLTAVIFLLIVAAAVVYAGGQLLGAETRARATVWATSMFIGALIGVLIYVIVPFVLEKMMNQAIGAC